MARKPHTPDAADAASTIEAASAAATPATTVAIPTVEGTDITTEQTSAPAADNATPDAAADTTPPMVADADAAIVAAQANVSQIEAALGVLGADNPAAAALQAALDTANGSLALAVADAALVRQKHAELSAAANAAQLAGVGADIAALMLAAIEAKYAPAPPAVEVTPDATPDATARRTVSDRALALNAAAAADTGMQARAADTVAAFDADSARLACNVQRKPNTRFSGMVALAPSGAGVTSYADYDALTRAIRAYLVNVKRWPTTPNDGQSVPEAKWLASRGRYILGGGVKSALACFNGSGAEIALYADGRFRFAYRGQSDVRFLRTDNAAWNAFVGGASAATVATPTPPATTPDAPTAPRTAPTPPTVQATASGVLATTARCQHCAARNIVGTPECAACGAGDWLAA